MFLDKFEIRTKLSKVSKKDKKTESVEEQIGEATGKLINEIATEILKRAAIAVIVVAVSYKTIDTISQVIIKKTKAG